MENFGCKYWPLLIRDEADSLHKLIILSPSSERIEILPCPKGRISQYLPSFGGARTISQHQFFYREWIRKSFPVDREGLTVLKSILPC